MYIMGSDGKSNYYHECSICKNYTIYREMTVVANSGVRACHGCLRDSYFLAKDDMFELEEAWAGWEKITKFPNSNPRYADRCCCPDKSKCVLVCVVKTNAKRSFSVICWSCGAAGSPIKHKIIKDAGINFDFVPVYVDNSGRNKCAVDGCKNKGTELHHYAPSHLFEDSNDWPIGYLCVKHHIDWHRKTKTGMFYNKRNF